jgi:hypothetical protein
MEEVESHLASINHLLCFPYLGVEAACSCSSEWEEVQANGRGWLTGPFPSLALLSHPLIFGFFTTHLIVGSKVNEFISIHTQTYTESDDNGLQDNLTLRGSI